MPWPVRTLLLLSLVILPAYMYVGFRLAAATSTVTGWRKSRARKIVALFGIPVFALPILYLLAYFTGTPRLLFVFSPAVTVFDYLLHLPFWWGIVILLEILPIFVVVDLVGLVLRFSASSHAGWHRWTAYGRIGLLCVLGVYVPIRSYADTYHVRDSGLSVAIPHLPSELDGFRVSVAGDIQVDRYTGEGKILQMRNILQARDPQLLLFTGDLVTSGTGFLAAATRALCPPLGSVGNVAVMGDHDFWSDKEEIPRIMRNCGWEFLENRHSILEHNGRTIVITGLTHVYASRLTAPVIDSILSSAPAADLKILVVHQPAEELLARVADYGYDLIVAGHTHGGQIVVHPFGIPFAPSRLETEYYSGMFRLKSTTIIVTNGIGLTLAPIRYHAPAEVSSVTLTTETGS